MNVLRTSTKRLGANVRLASRRFTTEAAPEMPKPNAKLSYDEKWQRHSKKYIFGTFIAAYVLGSMVSRGSSCDSKRELRHRMREMRTENEHLAARVDGLQRALDEQRRYQGAYQAPATSAVEPYRK
ncbi:hypothetical protein SDRG_15338 [Saprolegnia diclina VS20]|uniref:Uncharacterized protein n=1 Tax=Saprolegnia diclina (strain VS20) TaxID=1156394 RepID=T0RB99_SAPDV|nr:hypothetical protein SDRG_15338 [Saprolegnia diclina VS20]EQC26827.1 hypothetical protein SDRG_15338 [Saprolegnia diclina VS20]|eukprot:XP_008619729.1 hypothetical protein SDRG_15338 [Saprolegnia diclina VS20]